MLRQILTLFAVISGLGLTAQPTSVLAADVVSVAQAAESAEHELAGVPLAQPSERTAHHVVPATPRRQISVPLWAPAVLIRVDRAHE